MKMSRLCLFSLFLGITLLFCGAPSANAAPYPTDGKYRLALTSGSTGGSWYAVGAVFSETIKQYLPNCNVTVQVGGGVSNPSLIDSGKMDFGFTYSPALIAAVAGNAPYGKPLTHLRAIARMEPCLGVAFATKSSGITSFEQIRDQKLKVRMAVPAVGNFGEACASAILKAYGLDYSILKANGGSVQFVSHPEAADLFRDGHIDIYICAAGLGHANVTEMCLSREMVFLPVAGEALPYLQKLGYEEDIIPKGAFTGVTENVPAIVYSAVWLVRDDTPNELAYYFTKCLYEKIGDLAAAYSAIKERPMDQMPKVYGAPMHPAAEQFYKEVGLLK